MQNRRLWILIAATAVALGFSALLNQRGSDSADPVVGKPLVPGLAEKLDKVQGVSIRRAGDVVVAELKRQGEGFVVANKGGYPADVGALRSFLLKLSDATIRESKTANPERHGQLGVEDLAQADAKGIGVTIEVDGKSEQLIIGSIASGGGSGTYVRRADAAQSYLVSGSIRPDEGLASWIQAEILSLPASRLKSATVIAPDGATLTVAKASPDEANWSIEKLPKGREPSSEWAANSLTSTPDSLRLEDVAPASERAPEGEIWTGRYLSFEGVAVELVLWKHDGKDWLQARASFDESRFATWLDAEVTRERARVAQAKEAAEAIAKPKEDEASDAGEGGEGKEAKEGDALPLTPAVPDFDEEKFRADKRKAFEDEVAAINARTGNWSYQVAGWKAENLRKRIDDLLKAK